MNFKAAMDSLEWAAAQMERDRCAAIVQRYIDNTNADIAHAILREIRDGRVIAPNVPNDGNHPDTTAH